MARSAGRDRQDAGGIGTRWHRRRQACAIGIAALASMAANRTRTAQRFRLESGAWLDLSRVTGVGHTARRKGSMVGEATGNRCCAARYRAACPQGPAFANLRAAAGLDAITQPDELLLALFGLGAFRLSSSSIALVLIAQVTSVASFIIENRITMRLYSKLWKNTVCSAIVVFPR